MNFFEWLKNKGFITSIDIFGIVPQVYISNYIFVIFILTFLFLSIAYKSFVKSLTFAFIYTLTFGISIPTLMLVLAFLILCFNSLFLGVLSILMSHVLIGSVTPILILFKYVALKPKGANLAFNFFVSIFFIFIFEVLDIPQILKFKIADTFVTRLDPSFLLGSFHYSFPRALLGEKLSSLALFGIGIILLDDIFRLKNFIFFIFSIYLFFKPNLYLIYLCFFLIPVLEVNKSKKFLLFMFYCLLPEKLATTIESYANILPLSVFERLFEPLIPGVIICIVLFSILLTIKEVSNFSLIILTGIMAFYIQSPFLLPEYEFSVIEIQDIPSQELLEKIKRVTVGKIKLDQFFLERFKDKNVEIFYSESKWTSFELQKPIFFNKIRLEWGHQLKHPLKLFLRCGDKDVTINFRGLVQGSTRVAAKNLTGLTLSINSWCQEILVSDCCEKFEFPFEISNLRYE